MTSGKDVGTRWSKTLKIICHYQRIIVDDIEIEILISRKGDEIIGYEFTVVFNVKSFRDSPLDAVVRYHHTKMPPVDWEYFVCDSETPISSLVNGIFQEKCKMLEGILVL
jgi:hypothetical protein